MVINGIIKVFGPYCKKQLFALLGMLCVQEAIHGNKGANACGGAEAVDKDVDRVTVAFRNEALVIFVDTRINNGNYERKNHGFEAREFFAFDTTEEVCERGA